MPTYRYNVIVEVDIETSKLPNGKAQVSSVFGALERESSASSSRIRETQGAMLKDLDSMWQRSAKIWEQTERAKVAEEERIVDELIEEAQRLQKSRLLEQEKAATREMQIERERVEYMVQSIKRETAAREGELRERAAAMEKGFRDIENAERQIREKLQQNDPFQTLGNRNVPLNQAGAALREGERNNTLSQVTSLNAAIAANDPFQNLGARQVDTYTAGGLLANKEYQDFNNSIKQLDPFQNLGARQKSLKEAAKDLKDFDEQAAKSTKTYNRWSEAFKGAFIGAVAGMTFSAVIGGITSVIDTIEQAAVSSVKLAANFEETTNALTVFTGSTKDASAELAHMDNIAMNTTGLRLESAEQGYERLRALGFQAEITSGLIKGLGTQRVLSGATDQDVTRVIVNLTQLSASSQNASRDIKEMIHAIPSLRGVFFDAFGTLDPKKLRDILEQNPDEFFRRFSKAMQDTKQAQGGLNNEVEKFLDTLVIVGREAGKPVLEPLTDALREMRGYLTDNQDAWTSWGVYVGDIIRGVTAAAEDWNREKPENPRQKALRESSDPTDRAAAKIGDWLDRNSGRIVADTLTLGLAEIPRAYAERGRQERPVNRILYDEKGKYIPTQEERETKDKARAQMLQEEQQRLMAVERTRNAWIENEKDLYNTLSDLTTQYYKIEEAKAGAHLDLTTTQQLDTFKKQTSIHQQGLRAQIKLTTTYYDEMAKFGSLSREEQYKMSKERNDKLSKLNTELAESELNEQKQLQEYEHRLFEERRQARIEALNNELALTQSYGERQNNFWRNALQDQIADARTGYDALIQVENQTYQETLRIQKQTLAEQLLDQSLTQDQIRNLKDKARIDELNLTQKHNETLRSLEREQSDALVQEIEDRFNRMQKILQPLQETFKTFITGGSMQNALSGEVGNVLRQTNKVMQQAAEDFAEQQRNYTAKARELEKTRDLAQGDLNRNRDSLGIARNNLIEKINQKSAAETAFNDLQNQIQAKVKPFDENEWKQASAKVEQTTAAVEQQTQAVSELEQKVRDSENAFKAAAGAIDKIVEQKDSLRQIQQFSNTFLKYQADIIGLYDKLKANPNDYTIFDEIIEKNYRAERQLNADVLQARLKALNAELKTTEAQVAANMAAPAAAQNLREQIQAITIELNNFNLVTEITAKQLETRKNLFDRFSKFAGGDATIGAAVRYQADVESLKEKNSLLDNIYLLENRYYEDSTLWALRRRNAVLEYDRELYENEQNALTEIEIAQKRILNQTTYSSAQSTAKVLDFLASQKSITDIMSDTKINLISTAYSQLDNVIGRLTKNFGAFGDVLKDVLSSLLKLALNRIFLKMFGLDLSGNGGGSAGGGGIPLPQFNFNGAGAGAGSGSFGIPGLNLNFGGGGNGGGLGNMNGGFENGMFGLPGSLHELGHAGADGGGVLGNLGAGAPVGTTGIGGQGGGLLSAFTQNPMMGALLGATLGAGIGAKFGRGASVGASILGAAGLGAVGLVGGMALPAIMAGTFGGLTALGAATLGIGAVAAIGAYFWGRNAKRNKEKVIATKAIEAALPKIDKLIEDVNNDRIDGESALSQAEQIKQGYIDEVNKLTSKEIRNRSMGQVAGLDARINQLKDAITRQNQRKERLSLMIPTFADGGAVSSFARRNMRFNPVGYQTGAGHSRSDNLLGYYPGSDSYAYTSPTEFVVDAITTRNIGVVELQRMIETKGASYNQMRRKADLNAPRLASGGTMVVTPSSASITSGNSSNAGLDLSKLALEINMNVGLSDSEFIQVISAYIRGNYGAQEIMNVLATLNSNQGQNALIAGIVKEVRQQLGK